MTTTNRSRWTVLPACWLALLAASPVSAQATRYDPRLQFRTLATERFTVYFHQDEEELARRLVRIAEEVAAALDSRLGAPRGRVHVILVDQSDQPNGWATVIPYNLIEITAAPPPSASFIGNTNDWLRVVFAHEYAHVVHLEKSGGWLGKLRHVFGRLPIFYPNLALPDWQIEGVATREESALTGFGRIRAGDFRMIVRHAAAERRFPPLDRATGAVVDWPSGHSPYLYGGLFHEYLARKYGSESLARLVEETASRLPFLGSRAFRSVYGRSLGELWQDFEADVRGGSAVGRAIAEQPSGAASGHARTRLTYHGFSVTSPLFTRDGRLFYSLANPHGFPALMQRRDDGSSRRVATRYGGNRLAAARNELVFDQLEFVAHVDLQSDLYAVPADGGATRRLTHNARAADPDVAPDGETVACTVQETGRRILATLKVPSPGTTAAPVPLLAEPATEFTAPRWSPDGRSIAVERRRLGGPSDIVVIDVATRAVRTLVSSPAARNTLPAWLPDGRTLLFSSDRDGGTFTLFAVDVGSGTIRRVSGAGDGAQAPALSPDGRRLAFVGYSSDGYDLYSIPFDAGRWTDAGSPAVSPVDFEAEARRRRPSNDGAAARGAYRPWPTLAPKSWVPILESDGDDVVLGAAAGGSDALGRHLYDARFGWNIERSRPDVRVDYAYARWWPTLFASVATDTDPWRSGEVRSRELTTGAVLPVRRVRWSTTAMAALFVSIDEVDCPSCAEPVDARSRRSAVRAGWRLSNAKSYGYSISGEEGVTVTVASELARRFLGADADAGTVVVDARHYLPVFPRHGVFAVRGAGAMSWGDERLHRVFAAGGSGPQPGGFGIDVDAIGLLRGFGETAAIGDRAAVVNLDYRFPLTWVQRGVGTWPAFVRAVHGAVFADAGHAWDRQFRRSDIRRSFGAELSCDAVFGSTLGLTLATGVAWRHHHGGRDVAAFARVGRAF